MILRTKPNYALVGWSHGGERRRWAAFSHRHTFETPGFARAQMANAGEKLRLAIGIFYETPRLSRAIAELFADGVSAQDVCLVGKPSAFDAARQNEVAAGSAQAPGSVATFQLHSLGHLIEGCELSASSGALLRTVLKHAKWNKDDKRLHTDWLWPELCARLSDHIRQGALVLMVSTPTFSSQHKCSRTLLRHSAHTVQTHEFTALV